jgi:putative DNA primase/helicase
MTEYPDCTLIAVPTGKETGIFVMEYDPKNGGLESFNRLMEEHDPFETEANRSPSGGVHYIFQMPNFDFGNIHGKLWPGIDIKATGGYHLVPPSHDDHGAYEVINDVPPQPAPKWLLDKIFDYQSKGKWDTEARLLQREDAKTYDPESLSDGQKEHVQKTVDYWQSRIQSAPDGTQNILIYTGARTLFSLCYAGLLDEEDAQTYLEEACESGRHPQHRSMLAIDSGRRAAEADPDPVDMALTNDINLLGTFSKDDIGNANRVAFWRGTDIRYDVDREKFFTWEGTKWVNARDGRVRNIVEDVHSRITSSEAPFYNNIAMPPGERDKKSPKTYKEIFMEWAAKQRYSGKINDTMSMLKGRDSLWCKADDFDVDPYHFNVANGVVDLRTGELMPHDRLFMCSSISNDVTYDDKARAPEWDRFMRMVMPSPIHRKYLQRLIGATIIGEVIDQIFAFHIGTGGNGKGVFLDTCSYVLGDYATTGQRESFIRKSNSNRIPADIASMEGKRMVLVDELNDNQKMDEATLKDLTGGGIVKAEAKNMNPWEYTPKFTLHFRSNYMPELSAVRSIIRRFRPVKWDAEPTAEEWESYTSPHHSTPFQYLTKQESAGILNWILDGTRDYLEHGLQVPEDLQKEAISMLEGEDPFLIFMAENAENHVGSRVDGAKLYTAFKEWYEQHTFPGKPPSSRSLYKDLKEGKYKDRWSWSTERGRFVVKDVALNTLLVK